MLGATSCKLVAAGAIAVLIALQADVGAYTTGPPKLVLGHLVSLAFCLAVVELGAPLLGARLIDDGRATNSIKPSHFYVMATLMVVANAFLGKLAPLLAMSRRPPPALPLTILIGFWIAMIVRMRRRGCSTTAMAVALVGLVSGTRILSLWSWPFHRLDADMLATIARALDELFQGDFPYRNESPPMPYLPVTLLSYAPARLLNLDIRYTNLVLDAITTAAVVYLVRPNARLDDSVKAPSPLLNQVLLPCLMLHPLWASHGANTQYSPTLLATTLLGLSVLRGNGALQALSLGFAVGANQMLAACGPVLFAYWGGRLGWKRALGLATLAAAVFFLSIAPFLLWEPRPFLETVLLSRPSFSDAVMAGRFTLLPAASRILPHASLLGSLAAVSAASWVAYRAAKPSTAATAMAIGLCAALMFQPVSFGHYVLPVVALVATTPVEPEP